MRRPEGMEIFAKVWILSLTRIACMHIKTITWQDLYTRGGIHRWRHCTCAPDEPK